jgi:hypothetical protein
VRWLSDEPIPGVVEVEFVDADGMRHILVDKAPIFGADLKPDTPYPVDVLVACEIFDPQDPTAVPSSPPIARGVSIPRTGAANSSSSPASYWLADQDPLANRS